ncbi:MAG: GDSL-type esterase/lipase family protein [Actinomycetota bacterium]|nr:GDSL-type esterase/lipase family protein [Actinomycetota bacterium]
MPQAPRGPRLRSRDAIAVVVVALLALVLLRGESIRDSGESMQPGLERTVVLAVGEPAGWVADRLPFDEAADGALGWLSPDDELSGEGGFEASDGAAPAGGVQAVTPESFDPEQLGVEAAPPGELETVLVTGDSLSQPLDVELARGLAEEDGIETVRDPHVGTGVSKTGFVDWGKLSVQQVERDAPDAVVVFIGANEGFPMPVSGGREVKCCGPEWAAEYASRVRRMMNTYRRAGEARVYWLTLPLPRDAERQRIARAVNAAIEVAAVAYRSQVRILDMTEVFTPDDRYTDTLEIDGEERIVREPDGIHLNGAGAEVAAMAVRETIDRDFTP